MAYHRRVQKRPKLIEIDDLNFGLMGTTSLKSEWNVKDLSNT